MGHLISYAIGLMIGLYFIQAIIWLGLLKDKEFETKPESILFLLPYVPFIRTAFGLISTIKDLPWKNS